MDYPYRNNPDTSREWLVDYYKTGDEVSLAHRLRHKLTTGEITSDEVDFLAQLGFHPARMLVHDWSSREQPDFSGHLFVPTNLFENIDPTFGKNLVCDMVEHAFEYWAARPEHWFDVEDYRRDIIQALARARNWIAVAGHVTTPRERRLFLEANTLYHADTDPDARTLQSMYQSLEPIARSLRARSNEVAHATWVGPSFVGQGPGVLRDAKMLSLVLLAAERAIYCSINMGQPWDRQAADITRLILRIFLPQWNRGRRPHYFFGAMRQYDAYRRFLDMVADQFGVFD